MSSSSSRKAEKEEVEPTATPTGNPPLANSVLRRRLDLGQSLDKDSDEDTSSSDTSGEWDGGCSGWSSSDDEDLDALDYNEEEWNTNAFLPPMARCQFCLQLKTVDKVASPEVRNTVLNQLADAMNDARHNYSRVVRYGHFHMRMINLVDPRSLLPSHLRFVRGRGAKLSNHLKRYRVLAPFTLCETCVSIIEKRVNAYHDMFWVADYKLNDEEI